MQNKRRVVGGLVRWVLALGLTAIALLVGQVIADPGRGGLFASDPDRNDLLAIRPETGRAMFLRDLGLPAGGLAVDVRDATVDALYLGRSVGASSLYVLDATTDTVRLVGDTGLGATATLHGLDFARRDATTDAYSFPATLPNGNPAPGRLLAAVNLLGTQASGGDHFAVLDSQTGQGQVVGAFGVEGVEALAVAGDGVLWASVSTRGGSTPGLYTVDVDSGLATFWSDLDNVGPNGPPGAPSGGLSALQFACDGTLYGGTAAAFGGSAPPPGGGTTGGLSDGRDGGSSSGGLSDGLGQGAPTNSGIGPAVGRSAPRPGGSGGPVGGAPAGGTTSDEVSQGAPANDGGRLVTIDAVTGHFTYAGLRAVPSGDLGGFAFGGFCPTLFAPTPGLAGQANQLTLVGATPGGATRLYASRTLGATAVAIPGCGIVSLGLDDAKSRDSAAADGAGEVRFEVPIPRGFRGDTIYFQAVDRSTCTVTNLGAHHFR